MGPETSDVTELTKELNKARETIRDLEERTKTILDSIHAGIVLVDAENHVIMDVNPEASVLIGAPKEQIVNQVCHKHICPAEIGNCPITDKGQEVDNAERVLITADGRSVPILKTVASINLNGRQHLLESFLDITQLKLLQKELEHLARTDPLTGIYNRRHFFELSEKEIARARRSQSSLSMAVIDIDLFKTINDTYGHPAGDVVLKELVTLCKSQLRPYDIFGRIGGEEFGITLVDCDLQEAFPVLERIRRVVEQCTVTVHGAHVSFEISAGIAQRAGDMEDWESIMRRADEALYRAKNGGRNRVEMASQGT